MATITAAAGGGNWSAGGSWVGGVAPTAADDALLTATSGAITIDGTSGSPNLCRSLDCTGYASTLTQGSTGVLNIGDASGGKLVLQGAGMTYNPNAASTINFVSTTTGNNITTAGHTMGILKFNGSGGAWQLQDTLNMGSANMTGTAGTLDTNGQTITSGAFTGAAAFTLTLGATSWTLSGSFVPNASMTLNAGTSTLTMNGSTVTFNGAGLTYNNVVIGGSGVATINNVNTFSSLTRTGTAVKTDALAFGANQTVNTALTLTGNSITNRVAIGSNVAGTTRTITLGASATFKTSATTKNIDIQDITMTGGAANERDISAISGLSGDMGGNSGITFTSPATSYWVPSAGTSTGSFSAVTRWANASGGTAGTGRAPLPQDTSKFDASSIDAGSRTITQDMIRLGSIDWTGVTNTPAFSAGTSCSFFGSLTFVSGMTSSGASNWTYGGRGSSNIAMGGLTFTHNFIVDCFNGTLTSTGNFVSTGTFTLTSGNYVANSAGCTFPSASISGSTTRSIDMGTGTWTLNGTGTVWSAGTTTGLTFTQNSSTINITDTSATGKTVTGGGLTYHSMTFTGDNITLASSNTFDGTFAVNNAGLTNGLKITQSTTQTLTASSNCFTTNGFASNLAKLTSTTSTAATLTAPNQAQISVDFMSIDHSTVTQSNTWYAGANSTDGGTNTRWIFTAPPAPANGAVYLGSTKLHQIYLGSTQINRIYLGSTIVYKDA